MMRGRRSAARDSRHSRLVTISWSAQSPSTVEIHRSLAPDPQRRAELERCIGEAVSGLIRERDEMNSAPVAAAADVIGQHAETALGGPTAAWEAQMVALRARIQVVTERIERRRG